MRRISSFLCCVLLGASATAAGAQSIWDASIRMAPQFHAYDVKVPFNEKISELSLPLFAIVPVLPAFTVDVGSSYAMVHVERVDANGNKIVSEMSGLTDTQVRANYTFGQDFLVLTGGVNIPTGSATISVDELEAATRIGSDFFSFPVSGFGSGLGFTGGIAIAQPMGNWNVGFGASMKQSSEYEPFKDPSTGVATKFSPGPEYRARLGADHPFGTGRMSFGLTFSKFGDDKSNTVTFNSGDRYVAQFSINNALTERVDYSFVMWNLYRTSGTLINGGESPNGNITNAMMTFGVRAPGDIGIEPSIETRVWTQQGSRTSYMATFGSRFYFNRGVWSIVPGFGFSMGAMEAAALTGYRATLGLRLGG